VYDMQSAKRVLLEHLATYVQFPPSQSDLPPRHATPGL